ncbi:hypothetical protein HSBAA_64170 [Vreelandella sulfidaeris]|uniref:Aldehyde oxidase/xanthine dehydrogenase a/b hammerhead domain-containing protein n=1 Tax=Vreelandella sulfidaeris TaxID=115553 RepID=A0A455UK92_9GAMM|nr:hypothetical protein HSBAA_64170 [Halomonas sulfidaeris]
MANQLVGYPLCATIAKGRIMHMDASAARAAPGVAAVVTTLELEPLDRAESNIAHLFGGATIEHYHQAIAVVVAETLEQARGAAALIEVRYEKRRASSTLKPLGNACRTSASHKLMWAT